VETETATLNDFRIEAREWITENYPDTLKAPLGPNEIPGGGSKQVFFHPDAKLWQERMAEKGWTCPEWPVEYGGAGLNEDEVTILGEELAAQDCRPPLVGMGRYMLGPTLLNFGTHEQKLEHLPKIASGEVRWCQGYSEPNAGSDLASLQMRAEDQGDYYLVNGSKLWTSDAINADWMFCLVRTDFTSKKHAGISVILYDRTDPAVQISPITLISGYSVFYETTIQDLKVPKTNRVGAENEGWAIAKFLLTHERVMISGMGSTKGVAVTLADTAKQYAGEDDGRIADPILRDDVAQQGMDEEAFSLVSKRYREMNEVGASVGAASSMLKYVGTSFAKNRQELLLSIEGHQALGWEGDEFSEDELAQTRTWLRSKGYSIEGGTSEIMMNIIATRVLGLPKG